MGLEQEQNQKIAMGYPSIDRYHAQTPNTYPPPHPPLYPIPCQPHHPPAAYLSSFHLQHGYPGGGESSPFHNKSICISPSSKNPYSPASFNEYYYHQPYNPLVLEKESSTSFNRVMVILMIVLISCMCMMSLVMWFLFGSRIPEFEVVSLKVSNFTTTNTSVTGVWDAGLTIKNNNNDLSIQFDHIWSSILYKEAIIGISTLDPLRVPKDATSEINATMVAGSSDGSNERHGWVMQSLADDRITGVVTFSLRLSLSTNFTSPSLLYKQETLRVLCEDLQVTFSANGEGTWIPGLGNDCLIRIHDAVA